MGESAFTDVPDDDGRNAVLQWQTKVLGAPEHQTGGYEPGPLAARSSAIQSLAVFQ